MSTDIQQYPIFLLILIEVLEWCCLVHDWISLYAVSFVLMCFQFSNLMQFDLWTFQQRFLIDGLMDWDSCFVLILSFQDWKFILKFMMALCWFWILKHVAWVLLLSKFNDGPQQWCAVLRLRFLLKIRSIRILDTMVCSGTLLWLFSPAWDTVQPKLQVGFICPLVVIDPTNLGATIVVAQAWCLTIFNLSQKQNICLFTYGNKAIVCVCLTDLIFGRRHTRRVDS